MARFTLFYPHPQKRCYSSNKGRELFELRKKEFKGVVSYRGSYDAYGNDNLTSPVLARRIGHSSNFTSQKAMPITSKARAAI
jgi:hypothetical protein